MFPCLMTLILLNAYFFLQAYSFDDGEDLRYQDDVVRINEAEMAITSANVNG